MRSILFTPATKLDRIRKAQSADPDWLAIDLEDGVGFNDKNVARQSLSSLSERNFFGLAEKIAVRINAVATPDGIRDLAAMLEWRHWPGMIIIPKVEDSIQIREIAEISAGAGHHPALFATLETADGIENAAEIVRNGPRLAAVGYGSADHTADTGGTMDALSLAWARGRIVNAAAIAGIPALDGVWLDYRDRDGLIRETELVKSMGFAGKIAIHPDQVAPINKVFSPTDAEIESSKELLRAAAETGGGAFSHQGKMIDAPVLERAKRIVGAGENTNDDGKTT